MNTLIKLNKYIYKSNENKIDGENIQIYSTVSNELGEAPIWNSDNQSLYWVDIINNNLFEKSIITEQLNYWILPSSVSSIAIDKKNYQILWLISDKAVIRFNTVTNEYHEVLLLNLPQGVRTNDGSVSEDNKYWFGTMLHQPEMRKGNIFSLDGDKNLKIEYEGISIPNTFCWLNDGSVLISDSFIQKCYKWNFTPKLVSKEVFLDLSYTLATPDGGVLDVDGNIWIALWGTGEVVCCSSSGQIIDKINLPVLNPSSCCFGGKNNDILFITSAREGLSVEQLEEYPHSGKVFSVKLPIQGAPIYKFSMVIE